MEKIVKGTQMNVAPDEDEPATMGDLSRVRYDFARHIDRQDEQLRKQGDDIFTLFIGAFGLAVVEVAIVAMVMLGA